MKCWIFALIATFGIIADFAAAQSVERCSTVEYQKRLQHLPTKYDQHHRNMSQPVVSSINAIQGRSVVKIPVVVHVIWNKAEENISNEQILSQIEVLNEDFRAANTEIPDIPAIFQSKIADVEFEFCLASQTPDGQSTTGITRTFTNNAVGMGGTTALHYTSQGGHDAWDPAHYLNIWVAKFAGGIGGTATFPGDGPLQEEGVEIDYRQFGKLNLEPPYNLGRTCTHEIGHYFNLEHVWGPSLTSCCNEDDFVDDTPNACETYLGQCPTHPVFSCSEPDMFMNFMFYTDDACMGMFTNGQKARMWEALNLYRPGLLDANGCTTVAVEESSEQTYLLVYGNPVSSRLSFEIRSAKAASWQVLMADVSGRQLLEWQVRSNRVHTEELPGLAPGMYWLKAQAGDERIVSKLVVSGL